MTWTPRRSAATASALAVVALGGLAAPGSAVVAAPAPGSDGIGDAYFPLDGNGGIDVTHYDIDVTYDHGTRRLEGTTTLDLTATQDLSSFNLDLLLDATEVTVDGADAAFVQPRAKKQRHELEITPATPIAAGDEVEVVVTYADDPSDYSYTGESNWLADADEWVTVNEPHMAPWWFASNDHPLDKATFRMRVTADDDDVVVSNGEQIAKKRISDDETVTVWRTAEPMTTYLAFVAVGDFAVRSGETRGLPWTFAISRDATERAGRRARVYGQRSARITASIQDVVGPYPFESTGGLVTSLPVGFALENQTRPIYPGLPGGSLLVHELAHQWFGDSVAVEGWRDIWLNEGFASYMEHHIRQVRGGPTTDQWLQQTYRSYRDSAQFWDLDIADPCANGKSCVTKIFDNAVYVRGAMTLAALRNVIGNPDLRTLLRTWAADRADGNGATADFVALAEEVSGRDLDEFFQVWLSDPRPPAATPANGL